MNEQVKCPVMHGALPSEEERVTEWWPKSLNLDILHQHDTKTSPLGEEFDYREALTSLDVEALKKDWTLRMVAANQYLNSSIRFRF